MATPSTPSGPDYCEIATPEAIAAAVKNVDNNNLQDAIQKDDKDAGVAAAIKAKGVWGAGGVAAAIKAVGTSKQNAFKAALDSGDLQAAAKIIAGPFGVKANNLTDKQLGRLQAGWDLFQKQRTDAAAAFNPVGPPLADGSVRLYRGLPDDQTPLTNDFTNLYNIAKSYKAKSPTGKVMYVDIPKNQLGDLNPVPLGGNTMKYALSDEHMGNVKELTDELLSKPEEESAPATTEEEVAAAHEKPTFTDIDWDLIKNMFPSGYATADETASSGSKASNMLRYGMTGTPPDIKQAIMNHALANIGGGVTGGAYGATQDPNDDLKAKIAKALLYGTAGEIAGHIVAGGPIKEMPNRFANSYINNLLTTGSLAVKSANDVAAMMTGPIIRGVDAMLHGRIKNAPAETIQALAGGFGGVKQGVLAMLHELDPTFIAGNDSLETGMLKPTDRLAQLAANAQTGDQDAYKELQDLMTAGHSLPSVGQYAGSATTRALRGVTEFARSVLESQEAAANAVAESKGYTNLPNIADRVDRALLMNKPTGLVSGTMYNLSRSFNSTPLSGIAKALMPFRLIPANMLGRIFEYVPVAGLLEAPGNDARLLAAKQITGAAALALGYMTLGSNVTGYGPTDPTQRTNWLAEGNKPWSVKIGDNYYAMRQMPPILQAPLRVMGAIDDSKTFNKNDGLTDQIAREFGSALADHNFFPQWLDLLDKSMTSSGLQPSDLSLEKGLATQAGSIVPAFMSEAAKANEANTPDTLAKGDTFGQMVQNAISARTPGFAQNVQPKLGLGGQPIPSGATGIGALLGSYAPIPNRNDQVAQMFGAAGQPAPTIPKSIALGQTPIDMQPEEARIYQQAMGQMLSNVAPQLTQALQKLPPDARAKIVSEIETQARKNAEAQVIATMAKSGQLPARLQAAMQQAVQTKTNKVLP